MRRSLNIIVKQPSQPEDGFNKMKKNNKPGPLLNTDKQNIESLLKSVMQDYLHYQSNLKGEKAKNINTLASVISEYLSAFIIIGYDVNRNPVNLIHAKNQMDADALSAAVNKFILNSISRPDDQ